MTGTTPKRRYAVSIFLVLAATAAACADGGSNGGAARAPGTLEVYLTDAPATYESVWVTTDRLTVHRSGGPWESLPLRATHADTNGDGDDDVIANPDGSLTIDLIALRGLEALIAGGPIPSGHYTQIRLRVATAWAEDATGTIPLKVPSGARSGVKIVGPFTVDPGAITRLLLDFDACASIVDRGDSGKPLILKPVIKVVDLVQPPRDCSQPLWTTSGDDQEGAFLARGTASAGDINGDGFGDVIVGAQNYSETYHSQGKAYVFHGSPFGLPTTPDWTSSGEEQKSAWFGLSAASAGDVDGDGFGDVVIGAMLHSLISPGGFEGRVYLFHGGPSGLETSASWTSYGDETQNENYGRSVASAGDVDRDGFDDVLVGASSNVNSRGKAFLYLGGPAGLATAAVWTSRGDDAGLAAFGTDLDGAGDVNQDGFDDVIVGAPATLYPGPSFPGKAFVFHGGPGGLEASPSWTAIGESAPLSGYGGTLGGAGDTNGDGFDDVIVGAPGYDVDPAASLSTNEGRAYVYFGGPAGLSPTADWESSGDNLPRAGFGYAVSTAGDVDGDGFFDLVIARALFQPGALGTGRIDVFRGGAAGPEHAPFWTSLGDNQPEAAFGLVVATAGDVYGNGLDEILAAAPGFDTPNDRAGKAYLFCVGP